MKLKLDRLQEKEWGGKKSWNFNSGGTWYSSWRGLWNDDWKEGQEIEVPDDRVTSTVKDGKTYWNLKGPPGGSGGGSVKGGGSSLNSEQFDRMIKGLAMILKEIQLLREDLKEFNQS